MWDGSGTTIREQMPQLSDALSETVTLVSILQHTLSFFTATISVPEVGPRFRHSNGLQVVPDQRPMTMVTK